MQSALCSQGHPLALSENHQPWICDGALEPRGCACGVGTVLNVQHEKRYRCTAGCDFDYCGRCYSDRSALPPVVRNHKPYCRKGHVLTLSDNAAPWICDGAAESQGCVCGAAVVESVQNERRYRCASGCDFDYCGKCFLARSGTVSTLSLSPEDAAFGRKIDKALEHIRLVLGTEKELKMGEHVSHTYQNKYDLTNELTRTAIRSALLSLQFLGLSDPQLRTIIQWSTSQTITVRIAATERCTYLRAVQREVESDSRRHSGLFGSWRNKTVETVTDYYFLFSLEYDITVFRGTGATEEDILHLFGHQGQCELKRRSETLPFNAVAVVPPRDINISWLLRHLQENHQGQHAPSFYIDQTCDSCHTPCNNADITAAVRFFKTFRQWSSETYEYLSAVFFPILDSTSLDLSCINSEDVFVPILPLLSASNSRKRISDAGVDSGVVSVRLEDSIVPAAEATQLCYEERCSLTRKFESIEPLFVDVRPHALLSFSDTKLLVLLSHMYDWTQFYCYGINYVEEMMWRQLVAAIGKEVLPSDFLLYMRYHNDKLFRSQYTPKPFSYTVRKTELHGTEGMVSIEQRSGDNGKALSDPINTMVNSKRAISPDSPMQFSLNASTMVSFSGHLYVHAWLNHRFESDNLGPPSIHADARQFSNFILLLGRMTDNSTFDPKHAIVINSKDELTIPLDTETIPSAKEFKNSIESLSPEQQDFASAFRSMQLESTLFALCVVQINPHLESLLNLPADSLVKEIQLCHDLMELFTEYQIPSDLLSFSGDTTTISAERIVVVKENVRNIMSMIDKAKQRDLEDKKAKDLYRTREIKVFVKNLTGKVIEVSISASLSVEDLKNAVSFKEGIPEDEQTLVFNGAMMENRRLLLDYGVENLSVVHLVMRLRGDGSKELLRKESKYTQREGARRNLVSDTFGSSAASGANPFFSGDRGDAMCGLSEPSAACGGESIQLEPDTAVEFSQAIGHPSNTAQGDLTSLPSLLEQEFDRSSNSAAVRPTIITPSQVWSRKRQKTILSIATSSDLTVDVQKREKNKAFELLGALSRSGGLHLQHSTLHVLVAMTHCFESTVMDTVVKDNINPIDKVVASTMIIANAIHQKPPSDLVSDNL